MFDVASIRHRIFGISPVETSFERRGFRPPDAAMRQHLESVGRSFVDGYNVAMLEPQAVPLSERLNTVSDMYRGFAFEGAAMALVLLDSFTPWDRLRFQAFVESDSGKSHIYMLYIGAGWAIARVPWARRNFEHAMGRFHPLYRWLMLDGYGFHEGFFYARQYVDERTPPPGLSPQAAQVFDQGLGRSMWFSQGGDPQRLADTIATFPTERHPDLWSGVGLAAAYAGGVERVALEQLRELAGESAAQLAQGAAFAAKARSRAGNPVPHTELACDVFCRVPAAEAAAVSDQCLQNLPSGGSEPPYQVWRSRIREHFNTNAPAGSIGRTGPRVSPT